MINFYPDGTKVKTNKTYFEKFGRTVYGTVVRPEIIEKAPNNVATAVRCDKQEGRNIIPDYDGNVVLFMTIDLELQTKH